MMAETEKRFLKWCIAFLVVAVIVVFAPSAWQALKGKMNSPSFKVEDVKVGDGTEAKSGDTVRVHYTGTLTDGTVFDSSLERGTPFEFTVGAGEVIQGWDEGIPGMKVGGQRRLTIPPEMGYGSRSVGSIPANSTLLFDVELVEIL